VEDRKIEGKAKRESKGKKKAICIQRGVSYVVWIKAFILPLTDRKGIWDTSLLVVHLSD